MADTEYFVNLRAAISYYAALGQDAAEVSRKVVDGEIKIAIPEIGPGAALSVVDGHFIITPPPDGD